MSDFSDDPRGRIARERLLGMVRGQLGHEPFTSNSMLDLLSLVEEGVGHMVENDELAPEDMERAERATAELLRELADVRQETDAPFFTEQSVHEARVRLCPGFWPFC